MPNDLELSTTSSRFSHGTDGIAESQGAPKDRRTRLPWRERVKHTTWAYFTLTMATGGLANVLHTGQNKDYLTETC